MNVNGPFPNPGLDPTLNTGALPVFHQFYHVNHPWTPRPAEYVRGFGWWQNGYKRSVKKRHYHFIWPKDGKRGSTMGRLKDILQNKGPDVHVAVSAHKKDYMHNRPRKAEWARHWDLDDRGPFGELHDHSHLQGKAYDFKTRKFRHHYPGMWTDAKWQPEPNEKIKYPKALRNVWGEWFQNPHYVPPEMHGWAF